MSVFYPINTAQGGPGGRQMVIWIELEGDAPVEPKHFRYAAEMLCDVAGFPDARAYLQGAFAERDRNPWPSKAYQRSYEPVKPSMDLEAASARLAALSR